VCDLGSVDSETMLRQAFDWAWRRGVSLRWLAETARRLDTNRRPGPRRVLTLVDEASRVRRPTESALEVGVEQALGSIAGLVRQFVVRRRDGSFVARVDFAIPHLRIAIEAHSRRFHFGLDVEESDAAREASLPPVRPRDRVCGLLVLAVSTESPHSRPVGWGQAVASRACCLAAL
jgi:hypothetical protein